MCDLNGCDKKPEGNNPRKKYCGDQRIIGTCGHTRRKLRDKERYLANRTGKVSKVTGRKPREKAVVCPFCESVVISDDPKITMHGSKEEIGSCAHLMHRREFNAASEIRRQDRRREITNEPLPHSVKYVLQQASGKF